MIAAWMLSAVLVGALVTAGAMAADRVFSALRRQTRFVWIAAMGITLAWPLIAYTRARLVEGAGASAPLRSSVQQMTAIVVSATERSLPVRADVMLLIVWSLVSAILLARMFMTLRALRADGRGWRSQQVDGVQIRLSRDIGPAVVGLDPMEVVLPEWALDLEPPLRALVLAHEEEHRRARDPYLLLLSAALIVLVPWNPALWLQARRLRLAIELDCDARVLRSHPRPERYGLLLLAIAQRRTAGMSLLVPALSEPTSNLERRINAMNNPLKNQSRVRLAVLGGIAVALVVVACAIDAPVAPTSAPRVAVTTELGHIMVEPEGRPPQEESREDTTRLRAVTEMRADREGVITAWMRDSAGKRVKVEARYEPKGAGAAREEALRKGDGPMRLSKDGPVVERGIVEERAHAPGTSQVAPARAPSGEPYYEFQVEKPAAWIPGSGAPVYPAELKTGGVEGEVLASFTVDATGRVDPESFRVLKATNDRFTNAIRLALPTMRFTPAEVGGHAVAQRVQQSFVFSVK